MKKIAILGAGNMGGALARGLVFKNVFSPSEIVCTAKSEATLARLAEEIPGIGVSAENVSAAEGAETLVIAVKPWLVESVLAELRDAKILPHRIISVAAGISLEKLRAWCGDPALPLFVAIPNTAVAVAQSMTFFAADGASADDEKFVFELFSKLGKAARVDEKQLAAGMAIASCGIAFAMRYIRAAETGGVALGLKSSLAREAVIQTVAGAAALLAATGDHPETAIDKVSTPGGITIRGLLEMEENGFSSALILGIKAAANAGK